MKLMKISSEILKSIPKVEIKKIIYKVEDGIWVGNGYWIIKLKTEDFYFSEKIFLEFDAKSIIKDEEGFKPGVKTNELLTYTGCRHIIKIKNDETTVWINKDYIDLFDKDAEFEIRNKTSQVRIYEKGILVGIVLPVRVKEEA